MPIYVYKCDACGCEKDVLQKVSDAPLTECPNCHQETFKKQVTASGFQLKGSGWYATDFKNGASTTSKTTEAKCDTNLSASTATTPCATCPAASESATN